jgi:adenylate cyclase
MCNSPFSAPFGPVMRLVGKGPWPKNPRYCRQCFNALLHHRGGAEVSCALLFADVRGSTALAETMRPQEFSAVMNRFFEVASEVVINHDGMVDKFVGDEIVGLFLPAFTGGPNAQQAIAAGREILTAVGPGSKMQLPIGVGVNSGVAYVGTVGDGDNIDLTAMGDPVNVAARLASAASAGELLVTQEAAAEAGLDESSAERRRLELKGKSEATDVIVLHGIVENAARIA